MAAIRISQRMQRHLKEKDIPHVWNVDGNGHDPAHWRNNLYHFAKLLFNDEAVKAALKSTPAEEAKPATAPSRPSPAGPESITDDFKPASTNQPGRDYPQVNSQGRVKFRIVAPEAKSVGVPLPAGRVDGRLPQSFEEERRLDQAVTECGPDVLPVFLPARDVLRDHEIVRLQAEAKAG